jgi:hypothetical protein
MTCEKSSVSAQQEQIDTLARRVRELEEEAARLRPVVEAAVSWRRKPDRLTPDLYSEGTTERALQDAIDVYRRSKECS